MTDRYDVIIIGSGAGGGTLAYRLAPTGKRILILERGDYVRREKANWDSRAVNVEARYHTTETWRDRDGKPLHPHTNYYVGGNTKFYGAALFRLRERDFETLAHHGGISPQWPIGYDELEPYYGEAEHLYQVHGERGVDPTEPRASVPYRFPKVSHEPRIQQLHDDLAAAGLQPFHVPLGVMLNEANPQGSACIRCNTCDGFPCLLHAKSDAQVICVDPALRHENVALLTGCRVTRLETTASGKEVSGVVFERDGRVERVSADIVVVSAGAIGSAALLLRSANRAHPNGLANQSDQVGRNYMGHINSVLLAISATPNPTVFQKTLAINDFYFGDRDFPFPMGHISFVGKFDAVTLSAGAPPFVPGMALDAIARHSLDFWLTSEDLPAADNRVMLDRDGNIVLSYTPNNLEGHAQLIARLKRVLESLGTRHVVPRNLFVGDRIPLAGVAHQNGTVRFGDDPRTSVLNRDCRAHDVDNLYVVDGSFFPSSGAVNPALTIMANALRVGDHLRARLGARELAVAHAS
ncbi:MAG TPA: GMC family oxidoreductase [Vicinamibacterales bacterium]|jgi:choline dehydrogenase-like flavoprotein